MNIDSIQQPDEQAAMAAMVDIRHISTEQLAQLGLRNERDRVAGRRFQRADARDRLLGDAPQFSAQRRNDLTQAN